MLRISCSFHLRNRQSRSFHPICSLMYCFLPGFYHPLLWVHSTYWKCCFVTVLLVLIFMFVSLFLSLKDEKIYRYILCTLFCYSIFSYSWSIFVYEFYLKNEIFCVWIVSKWKGKPTLESTETTLFLIENPIHCYSLSIFLFCVI